MGDPERADGLRHVPGRLQHRRDAARGKGRRILSRNHPEMDEGWLCDKGRFAFSHLYAPDRVTDPLLRRGPQVLAPVPWNEALDEAERLLRAAGTHIVTALSGTETVEQAYALAKLLRQGLGAHSALMPEVENARALDGFRRPLSSIRDADVIVVFEHEPLAERAPIVDLWVRAARRQGAEILYELDEDRVRGAERAILIWSGPDGERELAAHAQRPRRLGRLLPPARAERARRVRSLGRCVRRGGARGAGPDPPARRLRGRSPRERRRARAGRDRAERARHRDVRASGPRARRRAPAGHELSRARRNVRQPRGTAPATPARRASAGAGRARVALEARRALRRGHLALSRLSSSRSSRRSSTTGSPSGRSASRRRFRRDARAASRSSPPKRRRARTHDGPSPRHVPAALLGTGGRARRRSSSSSGPNRCSSSRRTTHAHAASGRTTRSRCARTRCRFACAPAISRKLPKGTVRAAEEHVRGLGHDVVLVKR